MKPRPCVQQSAVPNQLRVLQEDAQQEGLFCVLGEAVGEGGGGGAGSRQH